MIAGTIVPLGFLGPPMPRTTKWQKKLDTLFNLLTVVALANELLGIMYATVSSNMLLRIQSAPAVSVFALIKRDYELPWIATNVHFMFGLICFVGMVTTRALALFSPSLNVAAAGFGASAMIAMMSIANYGVRIGDGKGNALGENLIGLTVRYLTLLWPSILGPTKRLSAGTSFALALASSVLAVYNVLKQEEED